jgi:hypothetical protein
MAKARRDGDVGATAVAEGFGEAGFRVAVFAISAPEIAAFRDR